ncbi:MAG: hypothetical protein ACR2PT_16770, partial [Endozoicomonas sp.]
MEIILLGLAAIALTWSLNLQADSCPGGQQITIPQPGASFQVDSENITQISYCCTADIVSVLGQDFCATMQTSKGIT